MEPFELSDLGRTLKPACPPPDKLRDIGTTLNDAEVFGVVQQWLTEGIPYAFRDAPLLYETVRSWLAFRIELHPKEITLIGSGRIGYSTKLSCFGRPFGEHSDLDFTAVSNELFDKCRESFERWKREYRSRLVSPRSAKEEGYWKDNLEQNLPSSISRGFIEPKFIPIMYDWPGRIEDSLWRVEEKLKITRLAPKLRRKGVSLRVYRNWKAFVKQMQLNLRRTTLQL